MVTIGLIGGIASGKTTIADMLSKHGAVVLDADRAAHQVLDRDDVTRQLVGRWGPGILDSSGKVDRTSIAKRVFGESAEVTEERLFLESLVHPLTRETLELERDELTSAGQQVFIIDAPLLLEAGWDSSCDLVAMVDTPLERRVKNAAGRGWSPEELHRREGNQLDLETKRARSDFIIQNTGTLSETAKQVDEFWQEAVQPRLAS